MRVSNSGRCFSNGAFCFSAHALRVTSCSLDQQCQGIALVTAVVWSVGGDLALTHVVQHFGWDGRGDLFKHLTEDRNREREQATTSALSRK